MQWMTIEEISSTLVGRCPMGLASPVSWDLQCNLGSTFRASCSDLLGTVSRDPDPTTQCLISATLHGYPQSCISYVFKTSTMCTTLPKSATSSGWSLLPVDHSCISLCVLTLEKHLPRQLLLRNRKPLQLKLSSFKGNEKYLRIRIHNIDHV